ncbi:MAG: hypothetical protein Q9164_005466 [Protoblastenia rupestris]
MATELAKASPAHILIASRTAAKIDPVLSAIRGIGPSVKATFVQMDLSDHDSVRRAAPEILAVTGSKLDVVINSAGNMALMEYTVDRQGIEMQMSANHVGHFLLTNLLMLALLAGANGVVLFACHPGSNLDTKLGSHLVMDDYGDIMPVTKRNTGKDFVFVVEDEPRFKTYEQIGATPLIAALDPDLTAQAPAYLQNGQVVQPAAEHAYDPEHVEKSWKLSENLDGQEFKY